MPDIDVFISHKREEKHLAIQLRDALNKAGFVVGIDEDVVPNMNFVTALEEMINQARATVVLWTKASVRSEWVQIEARHALKLDRDPIKPNIYRGVMLEPVELPMDFASVNMLNFSEQGFTEKTLSALIGDLISTLTPPARSADEARNKTAAVSDELLAFHTADRIDDISALEAFQSRYPDSLLMPLAEARIREHQRVWPRLLRKTVSYGGLGVVCAAAGVVATLYAGRPVEVAPQITPSELETLLSDYQAAEEEITALSSAETELLEERASLEKQVSNLQAQVTDRADEADDLVVEIEALRTRLEQSTTAGAAAAITEQAARDALQIATQQAEAAIAEAAGLQEKLGDARDDLTDTQDRLALFEDGLELTQAARDRALLRVDTLETEKAALQMDLDALRAQHDDLIAEISELNSQPGLRLSRFSEEHQALLRDLNTGEILTLATLFDNGGLHCYGRGFLPAAQQRLLDAGAIRLDDQTCDGDRGYRISGAGMSLVEAFRTELAVSLDG